MRRLLIFLIRIIRYKFWVRVRFIDKVVISIELNEFRSIVMVVFKRFIIRFEMRDYLEIEIDNF